MFGKHNDVCKNRVTERWKFADYTDQYWDREICAGIYV